MKNFNQFSESSCQNPNNFQTSNLPSLQLHNEQEFQNTENKILPGGFTQFQTQSQVEIVGTEPLKPFGVQKTTCSKPLTQSVPLAPSASSFSQKALPSAEQKPEQNFHIHIRSPAYYIQYQMKVSKTLHLKSILYRGPQAQLHIGRIQQVNTQSGFHLLRFKILMATH